MTITLYDTPSTSPVKGASLNVYKARFVLNYKKLPFTTVWLPYEQIATTIKALGAPPSETLPNGMERYTVPTLVDATKAGATPVIISDSYRIAEYLDTAYPATPRVFPPGTRALQAAQFAHVSALMMRVAPFVMARSPPMMAPASGAYFTAMWSAIIGPLDKLYPAGDEGAPVRAQVWAGVRAQLDLLDTFYAKGALDGCDVFVTGDKPVFVDFALAALFVPIIVCAREDAWNVIKDLNGGRWKRLVDAVAPYMSEADRPFLTT